MKFCRTFFVSQSRKNLQRNLLVSLFFGYRKLLCIRRVCHDILSKSFCRTVPEKIVQDSFSVQILSVIEKVYP